MRTCPWPCRCTFSFWEGLHLRLLVVRYFITLQQDCFFFAFQLSCLFNGQSFQHPWFASTAFFNPPFSLFSSSRFFVFVHAKSARTSSPCHRSFDFRRVPLLFTRLRFHIDVPDADARYRLLYRGPIALRCQQTIVVVFLSRQRLAILRKAALV